MAGMGSRHDAIDANQMVVCSACLCTSCTLHTGADCLGCSGKSQVCCCEGQSCCKVGANLGFSIFCCEICPEPGCTDCCYNKCVCCAGGCICPETCCLGQQHCCCFVNSCSFPCTDYVPCMCTICPFLVLCPKDGRGGRKPIGCCMKQGEVAGTMAHGAGESLLIQQTVVVQQPMQQQQQQQQQYQQQPMMQQPLQQYQQQPMIQQPLQPGMMDRGDPYAAAAEDAASPILAEPAALVEPAPMQAANLTEALAGANVSKHEAALRELGCVEIADLQDLVLDDLVASGLNKIEAKRLLRYARENRP